MKSILLYSLKVWLTTTLLVACLRKLLGELFFPLMPWTNEAKGFISKVQFEPESFSKQINELFNLAIRCGIWSILVFTVVLIGRKYGKRNIFIKMMLSLFFTLIFSMPFILIMGSDAKFANLGVQIEIFTLLVISVSTLLSLLTAIWLYELPNTNKHVHSTKLL